MKRCVAQLEVIVVQQSVRAIHQFTLVLGGILVVYMGFATTGYRDSRKENDQPENILWHLMQHTVLDLRSDPPALVFVDAQGDLAFRFNVSNKVCAPCSPIVALADVGR